MRRSFQLRVMQLGLALALAVGLVAAGAGPARADGAWLDAPLQNWNTPGQDIPILVTTMEALDPRCLERTRPAESPEEAQVVKQGWRLVGAYQGGWGARIVMGALKFDGMCRPMIFQAFVFQDGVFAGTLSPSAMDSRTDGSLSDVVILAKAPSETLRLMATFARYTPNDALCCPSARSLVDYEIVMEGGKPLVKPLRVNTSQNQGR